jgi:MFS family permease
MLSGARRQIFNVFAIFLLVERFHFSLWEMSLLMLLNNLLNWILNPYIGLAINKVGEKKLLTAKYIAVLLLCLAYVFCDYAPVAAVLYVIDQLLFCFTVSIRTYFQKIADPTDIAPSMAMGVTFNHIAAVAVPFVGGYMWMTDYRLPFIMGAGFAVLSLIMVRFMGSPEASLSRQ